MMLGANRIVGMAINNAVIFFISLMLWMIKEMLLFGIGLEDDCGSDWRGILFGSSVVRWRSGPRLRLCGRRMDATGR